MRFSLFFIRDSCCSLLLSVAIGTLQSLLTHSKVTASIMHSTLRLLLCSVLLTLTTTTLVAADNDLYRVEGSLKIPRNKLSQARITLNGDSYSAIPRSNGDFTIMDVPAGTYVLEAYHVDYLFTPLRIDISARERGKIKVSGMPSAPPLSRERTQYPLVLRPDGNQKVTYFQQREQFNPWSYLKSPMVIMMLITGVIVIVMPRIMNNMAPEELEEMKRMQSKMSLTNMLKSATQQQ